MFKQYVCIICSHIYDERIGDIRSGIVAKTLWDNIPNSWSCDDCGATKSDFILLNV